MSLETKVRMGERSLLRRFLDSAKNKLSKAVLGASLVAALSCNDHKRRVTPTPINNAPVITTTAPVSSLEGSLYNYDVDATDSEGDAISYSLDSAPLWASINATSGLISGTPTDSGANRVDNFSVRATDAKGAYSVQNFGLNVTNTGTVNGTGQVKDIDGNGLASKTVHLWNTTYPRGRFSGLTNASGDFTVVDTNIPALSGIPNGSYNLEVEDGYTGIFKFLQPSYATSGNSHAVTNLLPMILMHAIASTNTAYQDSLGNASFLQLFKYDTTLRPSDSPVGGPHPTTTWPSFPQNVFMNAASAPSTDNLDASLNAGANGTPDYIDACRLAIAQWNTQTGMTLFTETGSPVTQGIRFLWPSTIAGGLSGLTTVEAMNADGTYQRTKLEVLNGLTIAAALGTMKHELGHALYNNRHTADGSLYIMGSPTSVSNVHVDEGRIAKYNAKLPNNTNMDLYVDQ